jgi:hypothetical protein
MDSEMFEPEITTDHLHSLWTGNTNALPGHSHPLPEDLQQPERVDSGAVSIITSGPIITDSMWNWLAASASEAAGDASIAAVIFVFNADACQFSGKADNFVTRIRRACKSKPFVAHVDRVFGYAFRAAFAFNAIAASPGSRFGGLSCSYPFLSFEDHGNVPPLSHYDEMLCEDLRLSRAGMSALYLERLLDDSIGRAVARRSGFVDRMVSSVDETRDYALELVWRRSQ